MSKKDLHNSFWQEMKSLFYIGIIALLIRTFIMEPFFIPSPSMEKTLLDGDYVFATKYSYGYSKHSFLFYAPNFIENRFLASEPRRGDIIIFRSNHDNLQRRYIKRLIGLPGDKIQMISGILYINDKPVGKEFEESLKDKKGTTYKKYKETLPNGISHNTYYLGDNEPSVRKLLDTTKAFNVPEGHYFFMGDNRNNSDDSRFSIGFVPFENLIAKAQFILFATEQRLWNSNFTITEQIAQFYHWIASIRFNRMFRSVYEL